MKAPINWLKDYVDMTLPPAELARRITLAGFEVGELLNIGGSWENVVVGRITAVNPHPNADRLRLATVDLGVREEVVVCGAPNLKIGDKIAFAGLGARLINPHTGQEETLKTAKIRGVVSSGMVCSERELGISDNHEGIMVLSQDVRVGMPLAECLGDTVLDLDVTPNRPDILSVVGIAREIAALTGQKMHIPEIVYKEAGEPVDGRIKIEIADPDLCPRYCATLITGIKITESPAWMKERLIACGQRPINNIVDISNYVMLEYGQPLHTFDYDRVRGKKIIVRRAAERERFTTLDDCERKLSSDTLVIGDGEGTVAIAGVMGGANSEVTGDTCNILLEAANFSAASIHYTSNQLLLKSEASMRFERGISPGLTIPALKHATRLIAELGGGTVAPGIVDIYPGKRDVEPVSLAVEEVKRILGVEFSREQVMDTLTSLGFECKTENKQISVSVPYWRSDIRQEVDLIEEVVRIIGYDSIPTTLLGDPLPQQNPEPVIGLKDRIRRSLVGYGFHEVITYSLTGADTLSNLSSVPAMPEPLPLRVANPMTADQEYLRPNLRANLLSVLEANRRHEDDGIRIFELGKVFIRRKDELPSEPEVLCGLLSGDRIEKSWLGGDGQFDFYDAKGAVEGLLRCLDITANFEHGNDHGLHPARQAAIFIEDNNLKVKLGVLGELHPAVADAFEITGVVCLFEINVTALLPFTTTQKMYQPVLRFPTTARDLALVVDVGVTHRRIKDIMESFPLLSEVLLFDVYSGKQVAEGKKSLAYRLVYQSPTHTLTDEEVNHVQAQILDRLNKELGATLRG